MFKKTLKVLSLVAVLSLSANANDLLADISKGAISDNSLGVKVLNPEQMSEVRGGYMVHAYAQGNEAYAIAYPHLSGELLYFRATDGKIYQHNLPQGLCAMDSISCFYNSSSKSFMQQNINRMTEFKLGLQNFDHERYGLGYKVTKTYEYDRYGNPFIVFKYNVVAVERADGNHIHIINSSDILNNNMIIKELRNEYKDLFESVLGRY
ncbi:hypothetical protein [Campylobacter sp. 2018MI13]|uniref:hypothetical protein n=1 Tax=Campylobacter sp. 2018MI13 TaxID=2836737 RepID=UPI001BDA6D13|nr:hypothetical protein [Campylobacter sp. 2018MI13]MBT0883271.1 hypothetical protein [Campylobacter sp. 2018MI13]